MHGSSLIAELRIRMDEGPLSTGLLRQSVELER
jgi:hypothetical protein